MIQRDALRQMRSETGLTQSGLASEFNVGFSTVNRWENQDAWPNKAISAAILALAKQSSVSSACLDEMPRILHVSRADDRADKKRIDEVSKRMKLEKRVLLTGDQMKMALDDLDIAVIGQRIFSTAPGYAVLFYFNKRYVVMFGYDEDELLKKSKENLSFAIPQASMKEYPTQWRRLLDGKIEMADLKLTIQSMRKSGEEIWLEIKDVSLNRFSYGWELFTSCHDVIKSVEAERRYAVEIVVRDASLKGLYASLHCDLETNVILRCRDIGSFTGKELGGDTIDAVLDPLARAIPADDGRDVFREKFSRRHLLSASKRGESYGSVIVFNTIARRWMCVDHVLLKNPYMEAAICICDIQEQVLSTKRMDIVAA